MTSKAVVCADKTVQVSRLEKKLADRLESGDYYEAHQIYRTLYYRMSAQGKWQQLQDLLYNGAIKLLDVNEPTSAVDLAELFVESLQQSNMPVSSATLDRFEQLFTRLPPVLEKDTTVDGNRVDRRNELLSRALKWTMSVGEKKRYREKGHPEFHARVAKILWHEGNYVAARNHFILSDDAEKFASFLVDFQQRCGFKSEKDLFIAQATLQVLCTRRAKMASVLLQLYCEKHPQIGGEAPYELPLLNFIWLLTLCVQLKKVIYFSILVEKYQKCLERDPSYRVYLDKIGQLYFGLPPAQKSSCGGLLGSILKGLLGNSAGGPSSSDAADDDSDDDFEDGGALDEDGYITAASSVNAASPVAQTASKPAAGAGNVASTTFDDSMDLD
uniref:Golgi to ER traffic protein 4 homolog n=2 Tax=Parascaris univalens TaxID=6257 RepID=A0A915B8Z6_PARUN